MSQSDIDAQKSQVDEANRQLEEAIGRYDDASRKLAALESEIEDNKAAMYKTGVELNNAMRILNTRARGIYKHGDTSALEVIFNSRNLYDLVQRLDLLTRIGEADGRLVRQVEATKRSLETKGAELSAREKEQEALTEQVLAEKDRIEMDLAFKEGILAGLQGELERVRGQARPRRRPGPGNISGFVFPVWGPHTLYDSFGEDRGDHMHQGNDIDAENWTPCVACVSGIVETQGGDDSAGNTVIIRGNDGYFYNYMHLSDFEVSDGSYVSAGDVVGYVGSGHLHFEIRLSYFGEAIDPYPILAAAE